jgi:subtilisin family serine protease
VVIGHPDTGWTDHPDLDQSALDLARQWNVRGQIPDASDPMTFVLFRAHGTSTGTVLISSPAGEITGVAPGARLLPIRCVQSVVLVLDTDVARAIWYASQQDVDVISLSLGGHPVPYLEGVIGHAVYRKNIIFCAAAGNGIPYVVYPAAYPDAIAVAAITPTDRPWKMSSWGPQVTLAAPGHCVWVGDFDESRNPIVKANSGTSYAAPHVAAVAALWLAFHGRQNLLNRYAG